MEIQEYIHKIIRLTEEKKEVQSDIRDLYKQAKGEGHDPKAMKRVIKLLSLSKPDRDEFQYLVESYLQKVEGSNVKVQADKT